MTFRQLFRMWLAKERSAWAKVAVAAAVVVNKGGWAREPVDPLALIPRQFRPPAPPEPPKSPEEREAESRLAWHVLDRAFGGK